VAAVAANVVAGKANAIRVTANIVTTGAAVAISADGDSVEVEVAVDNRAAARVEAGHAPNNAHHSHRWFLMERL
jgi:hypothetical protein